VSVSVTVSDQEKLAELLDRQEIAELIRLERFWRDRGEWDKLADAYTADSHVKTTWFDGSGKEFAAASREMAKRGVRGKHVITPTWLRINGDRALVESLAEIHIRSEIDGVEFDMIQHCRFFSRVRRTERGWRLASFDGIYNRDVIVPLNPAETVPLDWDEIQRLRPSYRCLAYTLIRQGYEVSQEENADDRPDLLEPFYAAADRWLEHGDEA
jgi:hypothetical protein